MSGISLKNVTLDFPILDSSRSLRKAMFSRHTGGQIRFDQRAKTTSVRALNDLTLEVRPGDRLGLIGHNGAGKSTLLRLLAGVYTPTIGEVSIDVRICSLFNTSLGTDGDETGYENIYNIARYMNMRDDETAKIVDEVAEFSELGEFLDLPLRSYSSGMLIRLAFAVTTAIYPEALLLDEWLSAGDLRFTEKANARVDKLMARSKILVLASHSLELIKDYCNTAILLDSGSIVAKGSPKDIVALYEMRSHAQS